MVLLSIMTLGQNAFFAQVRVIRSLCMLHVHIDWQGWREFDLIKCKSVFRSTTHLQTASNSLMKLFSYPILTLRLKESITLIFLSENHSHIPYHSWEFTAPQNKQCASILSSWVTRETTLSSQQDWAPVGDGWSVFDRTTISYNNYIWVHLRFLFQSVVIFKHWITI